MPYAPLKDRVRRKGGLRLAMHSQLRDQLVEAAVEEWPDGCSIQNAGEVLTARLKIRARERYSSVLAMILLSTFINAIVRIIIEWWLERDSHRVLMAGWSRRAKEAQDL